MDTIRSYGHTVDGEARRAASIIDQVYGRYVPRLQSVLNSGSQSET
jgi:hypothetical protein